MKQKEQHRYNEGDNLGIETFQSLFLRRALRIFLLTGAIDNMATTDVPHRQVNSIMLETLMELEKQSF